MHPITKQADLVAFCAAVEGGRFITVDTEFIRDKTYFPKLCLLQMANADQAVVVDPLAPGISLAPVFALMEKQSLTKVFHASRQDLEIFYLLSGKIPAPLFDTQIAAAVCGFGESASYETLVNAITGAEVDKSSRFTDWSARPLSPQQLKYALSDVTHLCVIYETLVAKIEHSGRISWIGEEHAHLSDPTLYSPDPSNAWRRLKFGNMRPKQLACLRELARWREEEARAHDVPRGRILKDETLLELAAAMPQKENDLTRMRGVDRHMTPNRMVSIIECIKTALALPASEYPQSKRHQRHPKNVTSAVAMLQLLLKVQADINGIASSMIASKEDLEAIALDPETPAMNGWRHELFGQKAMALMQGKLKLSLNPKDGQVLFEEI